MSDQNNTQAPIESDKFSNAANFTFSPSVEGGYTVDNGGPTNYGITQDTLNSYNAKNGYDKTDVADMTPDDAKHVARDQYWDSAGLDNLPGRTATAVFDYGYNSGPHQAIKDLQRTVGATADGQMGPQTEKAVNDYVNSNGEDSLLDNYISRRTQLMSNLIASNPMKYGRNAEGWSHRLANLRTYLNVQGSNDQ